MAERMARAPSTLPGGEGKSGEVRGGRESRKKGRSRRSRGKERERRARRRRKKEGEEKEREEG